MTFWHDCPTPIRIIVKTVRGRDSNDKELHVGEMVMLPFVVSQIHMDHVVLVTEDDAKAACQALEMVK